MSNTASTIINGVNVFITKSIVDEHPEWEVRICCDGSHKTFTVVEEEPSAMIIKAIIAPYAVFVGEDPNIELAIGFQDKDMALTWMRQLPPEDGRKAWMVTSAAYFGEGYRYL